MKRAAPAWGRPFCLIGEPAGSLPARSRRKVGRRTLESPANPGAYRKPRSDCPGDDRGRGRLEHGTSSAQRRQPCGWGLRAIIGRVGRKEGSRMTRIIRKACVLAAFAGGLMASGCEELAE